MRIFFFLLGFGLTVIGSTYFLIYLNLFTVGFTVEEYFRYTIRRPECLFAIFGLFVMSIACFWKEKKK